MSNENLVSLKREPSYDLSKERGRVKLSTVLILGFLGIFSCWLCISGVNPLEYLHITTALH